MNHFSKLVLQGEQSQQTHPPESKVKASRATEKEATKSQNTRVRLVWLRSSAEQASLISKQSAVVDKVEQDREYGIIYQRVTGKNIWAN
jgi:hypothetical protein